MTLSLDVCVVTYKTPTYFRNFLQSYQAVALPNSKLYARVNMPEKDDYEVVADHIDDGFFSIGGDLGFARSCNLLAAESKGDIVGIFNADTTLTMDIWKCVEYMEQNPDIGILGPRQLDDRGRLTCGGGITGTDTKPEFRGWLKKDKGQYSDDIIDCMTVMGAAYFVRREVWDELTNCPEYVDYMAEKGIEEYGAFLPTEHWYEETFCSYHCRAHGYRVVYYGPAVMYHYSKKSGPPPSGTWQRSKAFFIEACDTVHGMEHEK